MSQLRTSYLSESVEEGPWQAFTPAPLVERVLTGEQSRLLVLDVERLG